MEERPKSGSLLSTKAADEMNNCICQVWVTIIVADFFPSSYNPSATCSRLKGPKGNTTWKKKMNYLLQGTEIRENSLDSLH